MTEGEWKNLVKWSALGGAAGLGMWALLSTIKGEPEASQSTSQKEKIPPQKRPSGGGGGGSTTPASYQGGGSSSSHGTSKAGCVEDVILNANQPLIDKFWPIDVRQRNALVEEAIRSNVYDPIEWVPIVTERNGHRGTFYVMADNLKILGVRVCATAATTQKVADMLGASLLTPTLSDLVYANADVRLPVMNRPITNKTVDMIDQSKRIDRAIQAALKPGQSLTPSTLIANQGKDWVISPRLVERPADPYCHLGGGSKLPIPAPKDRCVNYGWHTPGTKDNTGIPGLTIDGQQFQVVQGQGICHDLCHDDYSQLIRLVRSDCNVDGVATNIQSVLTNPEIAWLVSARTGALPAEAIRLPGVPFYSYATYS